MESKRLAGKDKVVEVAMQEGKAEGCEEIGKDEVD